MGLNEKLLRVRLPRALEPGRKYLTSSASKTHWISTVTMYLFPLLVLDAHEPDSKHPTHPQKRETLIATYSYLVRATHLPDSFYRRIDRADLEWTLEKYSKSYLQAFGDVAFNLYAHTFCVSIK